MDATDSDAIANLEQRLLGGLTSAVVSGGVLLTWRHFPSASLREMVGRGCVLSIVAAVALT